MKTDSYNALIIKEMSVDERPREKLLRKGVQYLSNAELLAIILRTGTRGKNAIQIARDLIGKSGDGIRFLAEANYEELCSVEGVGESKAATILAAIELGNRVSSYIPQRYVIANPWDIHEFYREEMRYLKKEHFRAVFLDTKNQIIGDETISIGTLNSSLVHPREVFKTAIKKSCCRIILMHNHPSGDTNPSEEDMMITKRLIECGMLLGIEVIDHLIIGDGGYFSFKENKLI